MAWIVRVHKNVGHDEGRNPQDYVRGVIQEEGNKRSYGNYKIHIEKTVVNILKVGLDFYYEKIGTK